MFPVSIWELNSVSQPEGALSECFAYASISLSCHWITYWGFEPHIHHRWSVQFRMTACIYYSKNWSQRMVRYPSTTGWSDNQSGVLCSIPIHPLVITDDWRRITRTLLGIKNIWLMAESQISLLYRCWIGLEPHQPIWLLLICRFDTTPRWLNRRLYLS